MIIRTEAIVLRSIEYSETSLIVTLFTREQGKVTVMAKGARRPKSQFGGTLQPMSHVQVVYYYKPTRGVQTLSESAHVQTFPRIGEQLSKLTVGLRIVELVEALLQEEEQNDRVFELATRVLSRLNEAEQRVENLLPFFQLRLAQLLGVAPAVEREAVSELPEQGGLLALESGAVLPPSATPEAGRRGSRTALRAYAVFARADVEDVMRMSLTPSVRREVMRLIDDYLHYQFESSYPTRGARVAEQMASWKPGGSKRRSA